MSALRTAKSVSYHYENGRSFIDAGKDENHKSLIRCKTKFEDFSGGLWGSNTKLVKGFAYDMFADRLFSQVAKLIRVGDELVLEWSANNNNKCLNDAGLSADKLYIIIRRETRRGIKEMRFLMISEVSPSDSVIRMCIVAPI